MPNSILTKLEKVMEFCNCYREFSWKQFEFQFDCKYPCTETSYLSMLVNAGYVERYARGKYRVVTKPPVQISYSQLEREAYG